MKKSAASLGDTITMAAAKSFNVFFIKQPTIDIVYFIYTQNSVLVSINNPTFSRLFLNYFLDYLLRKLDYILLMETDSECFKFPKYPPIMLRVRGHDKSDFMHFSSTF